MTESDDEEYSMTIAETLDDRTSIGQAGVKEERKRVCNITSCNLFVFILAVFTLILRQLYDALK